MTSGSAPEPDNYSLGEMMNRLKQSSAPPPRSREGGELVTRPDGTQVVRVRRRKRRTRQPKKEREIRQRKMRFARVIALVVLVLALAGALAGGVIYSNSRPFREALMVKIAGSTGADVDLRQFRMNPSSAVAESLSLAWPEGSPIESLHVRGLRAETSPVSLFGGAFRGGELTAREGTVTLRALDPQMPRRGPRGEAAPIDFRRMSVTKLQIMPGESLVGLFQLRDAEASFYPVEGPGSAAQLRLTGGNLRVPFLPELRIDRALIEFRGDEARVHGIRVFNGADELGDFVLSGAFDTVETEEVATLAARVTSFKINGIIGDSMGRLIAGRIDSDPENPANTLRFPVRNPSHGVLNLEFNASLVAPVIIQGFNFLNDLAILLDDPWFLQPYFDGDVSGTIRRGSGVVEILNLRAEYRNRMSIRGNLRTDRDGRLTGKLDVGLSTVIISAAPTRRLDPAFSDPSGGYRWITLDIGGSAESTTDNFMSQLDNPPVRQDPGAANGADGSPRPSAGDDAGSFENLTRPR